MKSLRQIALPYAASCRNFEVGLIHFAVGQMTSTNSVNHSGRVNWLLNHDRRRACKCIGLATNRSIPGGKSTLLELRLYTT